MMKEGTDMKVGDEVSGQTLLAIGKYADGDVVHITVEDAHTYIVSLDCYLITRNERR